jgi:hypothetical protein
MDNSLYTAKQVSKLLHVSSRRVAQLGLPRVEFGPRLIRYRPEDVQQLIDQRTQTKAGSK